VSDFKPDVLLDITSVFETKRKAMESLPAQQHLWEYYSDLARRRGVQLKRNAGPNLGLAGTTMAEVVTSVKRVTDIMAEISAASAEQSSGIEQVSKTVMQLDEATQQNAALVEEATAAAKSMEDQASDLTRAVAVFRLAGAAQTLHQQRHLAGHVLASTQHLQHHPRLLHPPLADEPPRRLRQVEHGQKQIDERGREEHAEHGPPAGIRIERHGEDHAV
jgi:hypothetical protein